MKAIKTVLVLAAGSLAASAAAAFYLSAEVILETEAALAHNATTTTDHRSTRTGAAYEPAEDSYWVAWKRDPSASDPAGQGLLQRLSARGFKVGDPVGFNGAHPQLAWSPAASAFLLVYDDAGSIRGRRFKADGTTVGASFLIGAPAGGWSGWPQVDWGGSRWFVAWYQQGGTAWGQFVNTDGTPWSAAINVSGTGALFGAGSGDQDFEPPQVAFSGGMHLVTSATDFDAAVAYRVNDATGALAGPAISILPNGYPTGIGVAGCSNPATPEFLVCWRNFLYDEVTQGVISSVAGLMITTGGVAGPIRYWVSVTDPSDLMSVVSPTYAEEPGEFHLVYAKVPDVGVHHVITSLLHVSSAGIAIGAPEALADEMTKPTEFFLSMAAGRGGSDLVLRHPEHQVKAFVRSPLPFATMSPATGGVAQFASDGSPLAIGAAATDGTIRMKATLTGAAEAFAKLEVEVQPVAAPFTGVATQSGGWVKAGGEASTTIANLPPGPYRTMVRAVDDAGATSAWTAFGGNAAGEADFVIPAAAPAPIQSAAGGGGGGGCSAAGRALALLPFALVLLPLRR